MTIPFLCVLGMILLVYLSKVPLGWAMAKEGKGYDNRSPREQQARLTGWGRRALAAHQNSFEILPVFASCVLIGHLAHGTEDWATGLSIFFLVSRLAYIFLYLANWDKLRSLVWMSGLASCFLIAFK